MQAGPRGFEPRSTVLDLPAGRQGPHKTNVAGAEGIEPPITVLETVVMPFN